MEEKQYQIDLLTAMNEKLMNSERAHRVACEFTGDAFIYYSLKKDRYVELLGDWESLCGQRLNNRPYDEAYLLSLLCDDDQKPIIDNIINLEKDGRTYGEVEVKTKHGSCWMAVKAKVFYDNSGIPIEKIVIFKDITKARSKNDEIEYYAYHDVLTGLYNRNHFFTRFRDLLKKADNNNTTTELMLIDINNFKKINDSLGLVYGDELVQEVALFIKDFENDDVLIGRYGSDVYCIAVYNPVGVKSSDIIYKNIVERLKKPFILSNNSEVTITVSAAVIEYPGGGKNALEIIKNAEIVLYSAKENHYDALTYYSDALLEKYNNQFILENKLIDAINNKEFEVYFQPLYSSDDNSLRGAEALLRWPDQKGGFVCGPDTFIPLAEKNGLIVTIGNFVFEEVFKTISEWNLKFGNDLIFSINISPIQLKRPDFIDVLQKYMDLYDVDPHMIELEITESIFIGDYEQITDIINTLKQLGIKVSLDDFGTGFSSLSYLTDLPISTLKIDKSFINKICNDSKTETITTMIIELMKKLSLTTVAEGVEESHQLDKLKNMGCDYIQGYIYSKPISKSDFEKILIRHLA